jgi:hypothetical protein
MPIIDYQTLFSLKAVTLGRLLRFVMSGAFVLYCYFSLLLFIDTRYAHDQRQMIETLNNVNVLYVKN